MTVVSEPHCPAHARLRKPMASLVEYHGGVLVQIILVLISYQNYEQRRKHTSVSFKLHLNLSKPL
jgi:hypothetical protein